MKKRDGAPTNAVYALMTMLFGLVDSYQPQYMAVAFVTAGKKDSFRHQMFEEYKRGGNKTPDELICRSFPILKHTLDTLGNCPVWSWRATRPTISPGTLFPSSVPGE